MCGEHVLDPKTKQLVLWTDYRKTMSWFEWFVPQCPKCFVVRAVIAIMTLSLSGNLLELPFWPMPLIFAGTYTLASAIGNAQPRNWFACLGQRKTKEP